MLRRLGTRSRIGLAAGLIAAAAIVGVHDRIGVWWSTGRAWWAGGQHDKDWRQRELGFLKQLYDRLDAEKQARRGNATASLRREQETILQRMRETAGPIRDRLPPEIAALLAEPASEQSPAAVPAVATAAAPAPIPAANAAPDFRTGAGLPGLDLDFAALAPDPELDRALERVNLLRGRAAKPAEKPAKAAEKPAAAEPGAAAATQ